MGARQGQQGDEIDLRELAGDLWRYKWWIVLSAIVAGVLGGGIVLNMSNQYTVSAVLAQPNSQSTKGGLSSLMGDLGGLAAVAGVSLPGNAGSATAIAMLKSNSLLEDFIREENIKPVLFPKQWSSAKGEWRPRKAPGMLKKWMLAWVGDPMQVRLSERKTDEPTDYQAVQKFRERMLSISQDKKTDLVTVTLTSGDPVRAVDWLNKLISRLNQRVRIEMISDADKSLLFLKDELAKTQEVNVRQAIFGLIEGKLNNRMVASVTEEVAFRVIDRPVVPTIPAKPNRPLIVLLSMFFGAVLSSVAVLLFSQMRKKDV